MTTYTWPTTAAHPWLPRAQTWRQLHNHRSNVSPLNGYTQTLNLPGARWGCTLEWPAHSYAERALLEGWLARLSGMEHRVSLHDLARPDPQGDIALTGVTLSANAAQFATSLVLAGARGGANLITYPSALDNAAWSNTGTITANTTANPIDSAVTADTVADVSVVASQFAGRTLTIGADALSYTASVYVRKTTGGTAPSFVLYMQLNGGTPVARTLVVNTDLGTVLSGTGTCVDAGTYWRLAVTHTNNSTNTGLSMRLFPAYAPYGVSVQDVTTTGSAIVWGAQVEVAGAETAFARGTLLAGDWLSVGGQLLQVAADATATDAGTLTVEVRPMLRAAASGGAAVTLDKPTALFVLQGSPEMPRDGNNTCPPMAADFVEVFA